MRCGLSERINPSFNAIGFSKYKGVDAERIDANFKNGVLEIRLPKSEEAKAHQISIKG